MFNPNCKTKYAVKLILKFCLFSSVFYILLLILHSSENMNVQRLVSVEFEVYGKVQGVFFRKFTQQESKKLGVKGWCMNTQQGTVQGVMEGPEGPINHMKNWLQNTGSPMSKIEKAVFQNEKEVTDYTFSNFSIKR